ncbi:MAG: aspartate aminotransferase family protein [Defluviitaleaceae bacterium]|nr:aspartate aminotransferase family protein [Defluviitaleaceae bacterium]
MSNQSLKHLSDQHILPTYGRFPIAFVRGEGCRLWDADGKEYIDFTSGIGVTSIGHAHPAWVAAIADQAAKLAHVSNLYYTEPGAKLAQRLCALADGMRGVFFSNSGAEANEGLIKVARKYSRDKYGEGRATIITLEGSFHGRTISTLAATGQEKFHQHFFPFTPGFKHVAPGDLAALEAQGDDVCALMLEPIQGEGGVMPLDADYVRAAAEICMKSDWLLLMDEVQTGIGRTGKWFGYQHFNILPDALSFAKGIAGGLPLGGFMVGEKLATTLGPGDHATTYGGNPICAAAALAVLDVVEDALPQVTEMGEYIRTQIQAMNASCIAQIRGRGLMIGAKIQGHAPGEINAKLLEAGLAALTAGTDILRILPPLTIEKKDIDAGLKIMHNVLSTYFAK